MTAASELIRRLAEREPVPAGLVEDLDPFEVGLAAVRVLGWPPLPGADRLLGGPTSDTGVGAVGQGVATRVPPAVFLRALMTGDPAALDLAAHVDVIALGYLAVTFLAWPALRDPLAAVDKLILSERGRTLGEDL